MNPRIYKIIALLTIIMGFFMALLDTTIVNITLPKMTEYFHTNVSDISWVLNGYNLAFAVLLLTASRLADQFGRKKIFMLGVFLFTLSSFLCGISTSEEMLIGFRVLQGLAAALLLPVTVPLMTDIFPPEKRGAVMGIWGAFAGLAAASGPTLGGIISEKFQWQWIFFINIPIGIVTLILSYFILKESFDKTASKEIDFLAVFTLSISTFALTLGLIQANEKGWTSAYILSLFAVFIVFFTLFLLNETRSKEPMIPLWLFKIFPFTAGSIALFMLGIAMMSGMFLLSFFLTAVMGLSELQAGLTLTAMPLTSMVVSAISGPLSDKLSARWFGSIGMTLLALSIYLYSGLTAHSTHFDLTWRLMIAGTGMGMTMSSMMGASIRSVPGDKVGIASGVTNMARTIGTVLGVAILVTALTHYMNTEMGTAKTKAISAIKSSTVLVPQAKEQMISQLKNASFSRESKRPTQDEVINMMKQQEQLALSAAPVFIHEKIKLAFIQQENEIKKIWPIMEDAFKTGMATAFSHTFKIGSLLTLLGVFFAFFCDPKHAKPKKA